jgi:DNA-binding beta-propeller fold protein YncE
VKRRVFIGVTIAGGAGALVPWLAHRRRAPETVQPKQPSFPYEVTDHLTAWDALGRAYRLREHRLERIGSDGSVSWSHGGEQPGATVLNGPTALGFDSAHRIFVADAGNGRVQVLSPDGQLLRSVRESAQGRLLRPRALVFDKQDQLHVADVLAHIVHVFDSEGRFVRSVGGFGVDAKGLNGPRALAFSPAGELHVIDAGHRRVQVFSPDGTHRRSYGSGDGLVMPGAIAFAGDGLGYVADAMTGFVHAFDADGRFLDKFTPVDGAGRPAAPMGLSIGQRGDLHIHLGARVTA